MRDAARPNLPTVQRAAHVFAPPPTTPTL